MAKEIPCGARRRIAGESYCAALPYRVCRLVPRVRRSDSFAAATTNYKEEVLFTVNYNPEITNTHVIRYNGVLYDITRVDTFEGYREDITLNCCRRARQK